MKPWKFWDKPKAMALAMILLVGGAGFGAARASQALFSGHTHASMKFADPAEGPSKTGFAPIVKAVLPDVVNISTSKVVRGQAQAEQLPEGMYNDPFFRQFFGPDGQGFNNRQKNQAPRSQREESLGSGVIVSPDGYILTNNHVIEGATDVKVTLSNKKQLQAKVIGADPKTDIAVLKIEGSDYPAITIGDSSKVQVGDYALAVGDPFGVGQTVTMGIVSAMNRGNLGIEDYEDFIQTDAPINPGNSGGALVNLRGELVGINSQIFSTSGGSIGIGFAIPSNLAADVMRQLVATGSVKRGTLGVQAQDLTAQIANMLGTKLTQGAVVTQVRDGSPADTAGIKAGDIVVALNGRPVNNENDLYNAEGLLPINSKVELKLLREGKALTLSVPLSAEQLSSTEGSKLDPRIAGAELSDVGERVRREGLNGVSVARVAAGSRAASNGLKQGDLIVAVGQVQITGLADLTALTARHPRQLLLAVVRDRALQFLSMQ